MGSLFGGGLGVAAVAGYAAAVAGRGMLDTPMAGKALFLLDTVRVTAAVKYGCAADNGYEGNKYLHSGGWQHTSRKFIFPAIRRC